MNTSLTKKIKTKYFTMLHETVSFKIHEILKSFNIKYFNDFKRLY